MIQRIRSILVRRRRRRACDRIREHLAWFGFPSDATDEEIESGCAALAFSLRQLGVSYTDALEAMGAICAVLRQ